MSPFLGVSGLGGAGSLIGTKPQGNFWYLKVNTLDTTYNGVYDEQHHCAAIDSSGNIYISGTYYQTGFIVKFNNKGVHQWSRELSFRDMNAVAVDLSGNVFGVGCDIYTGSYAAVVVKYNSSGTLQWQRKYDNSSYQDIGFGVDADYNGNVYIGVESYGQGMFLVKYNSSGTFQWHRRIQTTSGSGDFGPDVRFNNYENNVYIGYQTHLYSGISGGSMSGSSYAVVKYDHNGSRLNSYVYGTPNNDGGPGGSSRNIQIRLAPGSSGDLFIGATLYSSSKSLTEMIVAKFANNGVFRWARRIGGTAAGISGGVAVDSSGNVYGLGMDNQGTEAGQKLIIAKWNSSGTLQWQRELGGAGYEYNFGNGIEVDNDGSYYLTFQSNSPQNQFGYGYNIRETIVFKLPVDGSLTGTHGDFTYAASSFTESNDTEASLLNNVTPYTDQSSPPWSSGTGSYTSATPTTNVVKTVVS